MALYGILGDVHGNREALARVLEALDRHQVQRIVCLGDVIGYNADPDECVEIVRRRCAVTIAGNHDLIALGRLDFRRCSTKAEYALRTTRRKLQPSSKTWLAALPTSHVLESGVVLLHGGVRDVQQRMTTPEQILENAAYLREDFPGTRFCFFAHSHEQKIYRAEAGEVEQIARDAEPLEGNGVYFINPGSVDASRKSGRKLAECALFDSLQRTVRFLRVPYDSAATEAKAAVFGYRINPLADQLYTLRRQTASAARRIGERLHRGAHSGR